MATFTTAASGNDDDGATWVGGVAPSAGDDLIIQGHTLTLNRDITYNSVTFNNASARLAIAGTTRTVEATDGWYTAANIATVLITTTLTTGMDVTLRGAWRGATTNNLTAIATSTGGNLTLATIGDDPSLPLFLGEGILANNTRQITLSWSAGTLTTIGRFDLPNWTAISTLVTMTGGTWNHTNTGTSVLGAGNHVVFLGTGTSAINWTGDVISSSTSLSAFLSIRGTGAWSITGKLKRNNSQAAAHAVGSQISPMLDVSGAVTGTIDGMVCNAANARCVSIATWGATSACRINWRNQSRTIEADEAIIIMNGNNSVIDMTDLQITNAGRFAYIETGSAQALVDSSTLITNTTQSAQACVVSNSGALDGKVINLDSDILRIPEPEEVAADADPFGYVANPIQGTGLILDPAVLAAALQTQTDEIKTHVTIETQNASQL